MKKLILFWTILALSMAIISNANAQTSIDGQYNIADLMNTARAKFDLATEDAVFLLDEQKITWQPDGRLATTIHRIIWVNTSLAVDHYGDHRIPYDDAREDFKVITVRTWRDNQWWLTGQTGIVETLPEEMRNAFDYSTRREMMLLHNGIEIPCILEVAYTIIDKQPWRKNIAGMWSFQDEAAVVKSSFQIEIPDGLKLFYNILPETATPSMDNNTDDGTDIYTWQMGPFNKFSYPATTESEFAGPLICWSTWDNWETLANSIKAIFPADTMLDSAIVHDLDSMQSTSRDNLELAGFIADYVSRKIRYIDYDAGHWLWHPRNAGQIYGTAYGHALDRAVFAKALYTNAGIESELVFVRDDLIVSDTAIALLDNHWKPYLLLKAGVCESYYDPADGRIIKGNGEFYGRLCFYTSGNHESKVLPSKANSADNSLSLQIDLALNEAKDSLIGKGYLAANGYLNPYPDMAGLDDEAKSSLNGILGGILKGVEIKNMNAVVFDCNTVKFGFEFALTIPKEDDLGRIVLNIGEPSGSIMSKLPGHVNMYDETRGSEIYLAAAMKQEIQIKLDTAGLELIYYPKDHNLSGNIGSFDLKSKITDKNMMITRTLAIGNNQISPEQWPLLRGLLLAESHDKSQKLIFKIREKKD